MTALPTSGSLLELRGVAADRAEAVLQEALRGADDGELFLERSDSEGLVFDDGRLKSASYNTTEGFGLRVVAGETAGYAHSSEISEAALRRAAAAASLAKRGYEGVAADAPRATNAKLYDDADPVGGSPSPPRRTCCRRSTPSPGRGTPAWCRSASPSPVSGGRWRSCARTDGA